MNDIPKLILETLQAEHMCQQSLAKMLRNDSDNNGLLMQFNKQEKYIDMLEQIYKIYDDFIKTNTT